MPKKIFGWIYNTVLAADENLLIGETIRLWFAIEPMFGDYNWQGRIIGFLLRFLRIIVSIVLYILIVVVGVAFVLVWLAWPIVAVTLILQIW